LRFNTTLSGKDSIVAIHLAFQPFLRFNIKPKAYIETSNTFY